MNRKNVILTVLFLLCLNLFTGCNQGNKAEVTGSYDISTNEETDVQQSVKSSEPDSDESKENDNSSSDTNENIVVYVCGAVNLPGVYTLTSKQRIADAVSAAGGFSDDAQTDAVNLAGIPCDGDKIRIPFQGEEINENNSAEEQDSENNSEIKDDRININTADKSLLMSISGVGEAKADAIISYREKNGNFKAVEEIMNIEGIKEGVFNKIKDKICVN